MLQTNGVTESDVKEVTKIQFENAPKRQDDEKTQVKQNDRINATIRRSQVSLMALFEKIVSDSKLLTISAKIVLIVVWDGPKYATALYIYV